MSPNKYLLKILDRHNEDRIHKINTEDISIKKPLSKMNDSDWPKHSCYSCLCWVALNQDLVQGECRYMQPKINYKKSSKSDFPITYANGFCLKHFDKNLKVSSYFSKSTLF